MIVDVLNFIFGRGFDSRHLHHSIPFRKKSFSPLHSWCSTYSTGIECSERSRRANNGFRFEKKVFLMNLSIMKYFAYLARCSDGSLYTGSCNDILARERRHNEGKGALYTSKRKPVKIIYFEVFSTLTEARRRERQIKGWTREKKENLVKYGHPTKFNPHH